MCVTAGDGGRQSMARNVPDKEGQKFSAESRASQIIGRRPIESALEDPLRNPGADPFQP
jgi:hypothetical protein